MGGLSLLLGDSGGLPLVAGSNGEEAELGGSDRIRGGDDCHPHAWPPLVVSEELVIPTGYQAARISDEPERVSPLA
jgi:hypothetical protein